MQACIVWYALDRYWAERYKEDYGWLISDTAYTEASRPHKKCAISHCRN